MFPSKNGKKSLAGPTKPAKMAKKIVSKNFFALLLPTKNSIKPTKTAQKQHKMGNTVFQQRK